LSTYKAKIRVITPEEKERAFALNVPPDWGRGLGVWSKIPNKSEQLILHCCSF